ncbi:unnamed protein product [Dracunculus medinensis]|uniref:Ovule protein n=1 Tax=Dracunculus medinensis TaxID=318479 RepID=A0A0N4UFM0_DRAME|nr:unnamed protein product [Dracunculus medinensis]
MVIEKNQESALAINTTIPSETRKKEYEELERYQGLKEEPEKMPEVKINVVPVVILALGAATFSQIGKIAPIDSRNNIKNCSPKELLTQNPEPSSSQAGRGLEIEDDLYHEHEMRKG